MIEIINGSKSYYDEEVLKEINVKIERNKLYVLTGENGSGKTVFCDILCGFSKLSRGTYLNDFKKNQIYITSGFPFFDDDSFKNILKFYKRIYKFTNQEIKEYLKVMNLESYKNKYVNELSSGTKQKIKLISLFSRDIDFIILDEPFVNLDTETINIIYSRIEKIVRDGVTVLIVEHDKQIERLLKFEGEFILCQEKTIINM